MMKVQINVQRCCFVYLHLTTIFLIQRDKMVHLKILIKLSL